MSFLLFCFITCNSFNHESVWQVPLAEFDIFNPQPRMFATADDGTLAAVDSENTRLVFLDGSGRLISYVGAKGEGPGEFIFPEHIFWEPESQAFFVTDRRNKRISKWSKLGELIAEYKCNETLRMPQFTKDDVFFIRKYSPKGCDPNIVRLNFTKNEAAPFHETNRPYVLDRYRSWHPTAIHAIGTRFLVVNHGAEAELTWLQRQTGSIVKTRTMPIPRVPITQTYLEQMKQRMPPGWSYSAKELPQYWPYLQYILVDEREQVWAFLHRKDFQSDSHFYIFESTQDGPPQHGSLTGSIQTLGGGFVYTTTTNEDGDSILNKIKVKW